MLDECQNPFFPCRSENKTAIAVEIVVDGKRYPICKECWEKIADSEIEWGEPPKQPYYGSFPQKIQGYSTPNTSNVEQKLRKIRVL